MSIDQALEKTYQDQIDADDARALASNKLHAELRHELLKKIGDSSALVPAVARRQQTFQCYEEKQPVVWAICDALNAAPAAQALHEIFRPGTPQEVADRVLALKFALAEAHAEYLFGEGIEQVRGIHDNF